MKGLFYRLLALQARYLGVWIVALFAWFISTGYFLLRPRRLKTSLRFYQAVFPGLSRWGALRLAWRQYHHFAGVFAERLRLSGGQTLRYEEEGLEQLLAAIRAGTGGILVMSHLGSWEVGARLLQQQGCRLLLFMGARQKEQIERQQKHELQTEGVRVLAVEEQSESPLLLLEGLRFLDQGGLVSLAADRSWSQGGRAVEVRLADHRVRLSAAPWALALASGAPLFYYFGLRLGPGRYRFCVTAPVVLKPPRPERSAALQDEAQRYAQLLEQMIRSYPEQWYTFEPFLEEEELSAPASHPYPPSRPSSPPAA